MNYHAILWGLFGIGCGLPVVVWALSRMFPRGWGRSLFIMGSIGLVAMAGVFLLVRARPPVPVWAWSVSNQVDSLPGPPGDISGASTALQGGSTLLVIGDSTMQVTDARKPVPSAVRRHVDNLVRQTRRGIVHPHAKGIVSNILFGLAIGAFLFVAYLFLDASTRGQFSWPLRVLSVLLFGVIYAAVAAAS